MIVEELSPSKNMDQSLQVKDETLRDLVGDAPSIFRPIANYIGQAELQNGSMGERFRGILEFGRLILSLPPDSSKAICAAIDAYLLYISEKKLGKEEMGLYSAAYLLDRRYHKAYLTEDAINLALGSIIRVARSSNITPEMIEAAVNPEFNSYLTRSGTYSRAPRDQETAWGYWSGKHPASPLRSVAMRFACLKSSSANIERAFSTLKFIQGPVKANYSVSTMRNIARIQININSDILVDTEENECHSESDEEELLETTSSVSTACSSQNISRVSSLSFDNHSYTSQPSQGNREQMLRYFSVMFDFSLTENDIGSSSPALSSDSLDETEVNRLVNGTCRSRNAR